MDSVGIGTFKRDRHPDMTKIPTIPLRIRPLKVGTAAKDQIEAVE